MPGALLVLAPRHPERFGEVERLARDAGFVTTRRSDLPIDAEPRADVVVLDTLGELAQLYQVEHGGVRRRQPRGSRRPQHPGAGDLRQADRVRPATCRTSRRLPTRSSPTTRRFRCRRNASSNAALLALVTDPVRRARLGAAARALVEANRGAKTKTLEVIRELLPHGDGRGHGRAVVRPFRLVH